MTYQTARHRVERQTVHTLDHARDFALRQLLAGQQGLWLSTTARGSIDARRAVDGRRKPTAASGRGVAYYGQGMLQYSLLSILKHYTHTYSQDFIILDLFETPYPVTPLVTLYQDILEHRLNEYYGRLYVVMNDRDAYIQQHTVYQLTEQERREWVYFNA